MIWTSDKPTQPGWYWWRHTRPRVVEVAEDVTTKRLYVIQTGAYLEDLSDDHEWAGPLDAPESIQAVLKKYRERRKTPR